MDYLYGQLPEMIYDPMNLIGESPKNTITLKINSDENKIIADVLKTPGELNLKILKQDGVHEYNFNGSENTYIEIDNVSIQRINSVVEYYFEDLNKIDNLKIGDIYLVKGPNSLSLYYYDGQDFKSIGNVRKGQIYAITDLGLLAIATSNSTLNILKAELDKQVEQLDNKINNIKDELVSEIDDNNNLLTTKIDAEISNLNEQKQDNLSFTSEYSSENNKVVLENELKTQNTKISEKISELEENINNNISIEIADINETINDLNNNINENINTSIENLKNTINSDISPKIEGLASSLEEKSTKLEEQIEANMVEVIANFKTFEDEIKNIKNNTNTEETDSIAELLSRIENLENNYTYTPLQLLSYTINGKSSTIYVKKGWAYDVSIAFSTDKKAKVIKLNDSDLNISATSQTSPYLYNYDYLNKIETSSQFKLTVGDGKGANTSETRSVNFIDPIYWGVSNNPSVTTLTQIIQLNGVVEIISPTNNSITPTTTQEDEYIYYAVPTSHGKCKFTVNGFSGGFEGLGTEANPYIEDSNYYIYRSTQSGIKDFTIGISKI